MCGRGVTISANSDRDGDSRVMTVAAVAAAALATSATKVAERPRGGQDSGVNARAPSATTVPDASVSVIPGPISGERIMKQLSADATIDVGKALNRNILAATAGGQRLLMKLARPTPTTSDAPTAPQYDRTSVAVVVGVDALRLQ